MGGEAKSIKDPELRAQKRALYLQSKLEKGPETRTFKEMRRAAVRQMMAAQNTIKRIIRGG